jgi:hypothetical protein
MTSQTLFIDSFSNALDTAQFIRQKTQGKDFPINVTKAYGEMEVYLRSFLTSAPFTGQKESNPSTGLGRP